MNCPSCDQVFWTTDSFDTHWETFHQPSEGPMVAECLGCPGCCERRMSRLEWLEPYMEEIECQSCCLVSTP